VETIRNGNVTVLYILGSGRSGSTVLERSLVDAIDGSAGVGELRWIWDRGILDDYLCGCASAFHACDFWQRVLGHLSARLPAGASVEGHAGRMIALRRGVERLRHMPFLIGPQLAPAAYRQRLESYRQALGMLYESVAAAAGARVVVDSSKEPVYAYVLAGVPGIDLRVLHLVRDSRAVAYSWERHVSRPEIHWAQQEMRRYTVWQSASQWNLKNALAELLRAQGVPVSRLRYEDFVTAPSETVGRLLDDLRLPARTAPFGGGWHSVSGNPVRFRGEARTLRLDREWELRMPRGKRVAVTAATAPLLLRYGYPLPVRR
jgi:sulfotransferase family protein